MVKKTENRIRHKCFQLQTTAIQLQNKNNEHMFTHPLTSSNLDLSCECLKRGAKEYNINGLQGQLRDAIILPYPVSSLDHLGYKIHSQGGAQSAA